MISLHDETKPFLYMATNYYRPDFITSKRCPHKIDIFPVGNIWDFSTLLCFLNELNTFTNSNHSFKIIENEVSKEDIFRFISTINKKWIIFISITKKNKSFFI